MVSASPEITDSVLPPSPRLQRFSTRGNILPVIQVALLGVLSGLAYLHLTLRYPLQNLIDRYTLTDFGRINGWSPLSLEDFFLTVFQIFALYILTSRLIARHPDDVRIKWVVIASGLLFAVTLLFMYPIMATDIFEYIFHSRILVHYGQNPLVVPPISFSTDAFFKTVHWSRQPSPYGPLWLLLTVPGTLLAGDDLILNLFMMRALAILFYLGCTLMVSAILKKQDPYLSTQGVLLFAWNPLILLEVAGNGHNEIVMMFFALVAIYLLVQKKWSAVIPLLVASVLIKYITVLLLLPFLIYCLRQQSGWRARFIFLAKTIALSSLLIAVVAFRFVAIPSGLVDEANFFGLLAVPSLIFNLLKATQSEVTARALTFFIAVFVYLPLYFLSLVTLLYLARPKHFVSLCTWLILAYLGIACMQFQPWFVVLPIALGIWGNDLLMRRLLLVFTASALMSYVANFFWVWNFRAWSNLQTNFIFVGVIFLPPLVVGLVNLIYIVNYRFQTQICAIDLTFVLSKHWNMLRRTRIATAPCPRVIFHCAWIEPLKIEPTNFSTEVESMPDGKLLISLKTEAIEVTIDELVPIAGSRVTRV